MGTAAYELKSWIIPRRQQDERKKLEAKVVLPGEISL